MLTLGGLKINFAAPKMLSTSSTLKQYHVIEWITAFTLIFLWYLSESAAPFTREFIISDPTINHTHVTVERVSSEACILYTIIIPFFVLIGLSAILAPRPQDRLKFMSITLSTFLVAAFFNGFITNFLKIYMGRHRPDFIARCDPSKRAPIDQYVTIEVCTGNMDTILEGMKSTPSGHSSTAFVGMTFFCLWVYGQINAYKTYGSKASKLLFAFFPLLLAVYIALSRTEDYRHHFVDIVLGSLLGITIAYYFYRREFPRTTSKTSHVPYCLGSEGSGDDHHYERVDDVQLENQV